jgi:hypothetical protein
MATDERKNDKATTQPRTDKQDDKVNDLPTQQQPEKDAQVKGGRMKLPID